MRIVRKEIMGDIAEMIIEGIICERCGNYLGEPVGFPRTCEECTEPPKFDIFDD